MRYKIFGFIILTLSFLESYAQMSTWVKTLFYDGGGYNSYNHDWSHVGPQGFVPKTDGSFFVLNNDYEQGIQTLYLIDSLGNILTSSQVGSWLTLQRWYCYGLMPTPDGGCIYIENWYDISGLPSTYKLFKVSNTGNLSQLFQWSNTSSLNFVQLNSAIPSYHYSYYCDLNGVYIELPSNDTIQGFVNFVFPNDDYLVSDTVLKRRNTNGNDLWSLPIGYQFVTASDASVYAYKDSLSKFDASSGQLIWTKAISNSGNFACTKSGDGLIRLAGINLQVMDSLGNAIDSNNLLLPYQLRNAIATGYDGSILAGGSFLSVDRYHTGSYYSSFIFKLNDHGHGTIDSTEMYLSGQACRCGPPYYLTDGLVIAATLGRTTNLVQVNSQYLAGSTTYNEKWAGRYTSGLNYRSSDVDLNGVVNLQDLQKMENVYYFGYPNHYSDSLNGALIRFVAENHVVSVNDTLTIDVIVGSSMLPVDSVYAISLFPQTMSNFGYPFNLTILSSSFRDGVLGDSSQNVMNYFPSYYNSNFDIGIISSRTDHQDTVLTGDTIAKFRVVFPPNSPLPTPGLILGKVYLFSSSGYFLNTNVIPDTLTIISGISEFKNSNDGFAYPVPADKKVHLIFPMSNGEFALKNITGQTVFSSAIINDFMDINTEDLTAGIYIGRAVGDGKVSEYRVVVAR